jgi:phosphonate transport system permease protein
MTGAQTMNAGPATLADATLDAVLADSRRRRYRRLPPVAAALVLVTLACGYAGVLDPARYADALRTLLTLAWEAMPPDFSRWQHWGRPLLETLSMSVAGTALGLAAALPLGALAARTIAPPWIGVPARLLLNTCRSIPTLVWGILFVAAVGFGPLPGALALACHSTGMLGKFCGEILEHVDPAPGDALRSQGVSRLGVLRFSVWPQILPRLIDVAVYRWEHNLRAATTLGVVGAGGFGLELVTAFHLFEYREALALILVLLALVTLINWAGAYIRGRLIDRERQEP